MRSTTGTALLGLFVFLLPSFLAAQTVTIAAPAEGANVSSPVHVLANADGGSYPASAMRLYVDDQAVITVDAASLDTWATLQPGVHRLVVVGWNTAGQAASQSVSVNVAGGGSGGVNVSSPTDGERTGSPARFAASATASDGRAITAMCIYVDSQSVYLTYAPSLDTFVPMSDGDHAVVVQAWDNTGAVYKSSLTVTVGSGSESLLRYQNDFTAASEWLATQSLPDGAILYSTERINPYYSNLAAAGLLKDPSRYAQVQNWMQWYVNHLNWGDRWGLNGTIYDYNVVNGTVVSSGDADSTDSYAATFLSLAWDYYRTGDPGAQAYVRTITYQLEIVAGAIIATQQPDGLTWAKPDYEIKYLMDNCEAYRGLRDLASLFGALGVDDKRNYFNAAADSMLNGINGMWLGNGQWGVYKNWYGESVAPDMTVWYADASSQLFPILYQVIDPSDPRAQQTYDAFNAAWPGWPTRSFSDKDPFPWVMLADAAALMGDTTRVNTYIDAIERDYVSQGFPWTWYSMEDGWFLRLIAFTEGNRPF